MPFKYQGQYEDVETGLYYNRFRYYDSCEVITFVRIQFGYRGR
ncbi:RHS repeat-associated core domain-containing protein [Prevotella pallens]